MRPVLGQPTVARLRVAELALEDPERVLNLGPDLCDDPVDLHVERIQFATFGCPLMIVELHDWMLPRTANSANFLKAVAARNRDFVFRGENVFSIRNPLNRQRLSWKDR